MNQNILQIQGFQALTIVELHGQLDAIARLRQSIERHVVDAAMKIAFYHFRISMFKKHKLNRPENHLLLEALYGTDPFDIIKVINFFKAAYAIGVLSSTVLSLPWLISFIFVYLLAMAVTDVSYPQFFTNYYVSAAIEFAARITNPVLGVSFIPGAAYAFDILENKPCNHYGGALSTVCQLWMYKVPTMPIITLLEASIWLVLSRITSAAIAKSDKLCDHDYKKIVSLQHALIVNPANVIGALLLDNLQLQEDIRQLTANPPNRHNMRDF